MKKRSVYRYFAKGWQEILYPGDGDQTTEIYNSIGKEPEERS